jgi:hypothetical protein
MIGEVIAYAANRAAGGAVESVSRRALWFGVGFLGAIFGVIFLIMAAFWTIEPVYGTVQSAALIAAGCITLALVCFVVPGIIEYFQRQRAKQKTEEIGQVAETIQAVKEEAVEAVDYFGAARVMATAFMFGLGAARQLKNKSS